VCTSEYAIEPDVGIDDLDDVDVLDVCVGLLSEFVELYVCDGFVGLYVCDGFVGFVVLYVVGVDSCCEDAGLKTGFVVLYGVDVVPEVICSAISFANPIVCRDFFTFDIFILFRIAARSASDSVSISSLPT